jgi:hypothetical protein
MFEKHESLSISNLDSKTQPTLRCCHVCGDWRIVAIIFIMTKNFPHDKKTSHTLSLCEDVFQLLFMIVTFSNIWIGFFKY